MQKLLLALLVGLFGPSGTPPGSVDSATLRPAVLTAQESRDAAMMRAIETPPVPLEEVKRARAAVRHAAMPGEAGARTHRFTFPDGEVVEFGDRSKRPRDQARRERVVQFIGTESASAEPAATFTAAGQASGLSPTSIEALRFISRHEGGFDAINTWDRARFSWGFIQFAGGRGFRPALAHFKSRSPETFRKLLAGYGVDVLPGATRPEPAYLDPETGQLLRGDAAEQAFGDDPLVIALFIRAGRRSEVKQRQVEAAIRDYALPALTDGLQNIRLSDALRSPQGLAMLIDRKVHEGNTGRLGWALQHAAIIRGVPNPAEWTRLEGLALDLAVRDADARNNIAELGDAAATLIERAAAGARNGDAGFVPDGPSLTSARAALEKLLYEADYRMVVGYRRDGVHYGAATVLAACAADRMRTLSPVDTAAELDRAAASLRDLVSGFRFEYAIRDRLRSIREAQLPGPAREALDYP
ncbi:MAG: LysM peptidoglycan-binding protein [Armatimonadetes bacterium]|jgi:peptidoglycan endopeptidase LytF|nr:LysM peptidoglycan-binding protein [Armatimonadota bacterium]